MGNIAAVIFHGFQIGIRPPMLAWLTLGVIVECLIAAFGLAYFFEGIPRFDNLKALIRYYLIAVLLAPSFSAFVSGIATKNSDCRDGDAAPHLQPLKDAMSLFRDFRSPDTAAKARCGCVEEDWPR